MEIKLKEYLNKETNLEVECKFGHFIPKKSNEKEFYFKTGVDKEDFEEINIKLNENKDWISYKRFKHTDLDVILKDNIIHLRVTSEDNIWKRAIIKQKLEDFNIVNKNENYDYRISVNREKEVDLPSKEDSKIIGYRKKDRLSYFYKDWKVDLTYIISNNKQKSFEIEIEITSKNVNIFEYLSFVKNFL